MLPSFSGVSRGCGRDGKFSNECARRRSVDIQYHSHAVAAQTAAAERHSNRQVESVKKLFEAELLQVAPSAVGSLDHLLQAADECEAEKVSYQQELLDSFNVSPAVPSGFSRFALQRRSKRLDEDLKVCLVSFIHIFRGYVTEQPRQVLEKDGTLAAVNPQVYSSSGGSGGLYALMIQNLAAFFP